MKTKWDLGDAVRVTRNVRNDGTYPGEDTGALLIRRGSVGHVVDVGTFLQDQIIYSVHFLDDQRIVGCREEELLGVDEPWVPSGYEFRQKVRAARTLAANGEVLVAAGSVGEVLKVLRDRAEGVAYHVHFETLPGRPLVVAERALTAILHGA
ncbi:MAG TPA: nitrogen fixation protein NifZ [Rhodocyclaceae bacterium]